MRSTQIAFNPRSPSAWEARLRSVRAIQAAASELKDLVRHANHAGIQVVCEIDGRDVVAIVNFEKQVADPDDLVIRHRDRHDRARHLWIDRHRPPIDEGVIGTRKVEGVAIPETPADGSPDKNNASHRNGNSMSPQLLRYTLMRFSPFCFVSYVCPVLPSRVMLWWNDRKAGVPKLIFIMVCQTSI